jgi:hypothetical protein
MAACLSLSVVPGGALQSLKPVQGNAAGGEGVTLKSALNTVKVLQDEDISALPQAAISFEAAKGETEGAQIIARSSQDVASYDITFSDLTGAGGTIPSSAITVYTQLYMSINSGFTGFPSGSYPDALIPVHYMKTAKEDNFKANKNQGFWIDIKVPAAAAAGAYTGSATVTVDGSVYSVPVQLTVFNFTMPAVPAIRTTMAVWRDWIIDGELDNTLEKYRDYYDFLLEYNMTSTNFPNESYDPVGFVANLRQYYGRIASYAIPAVMVRKPIVVNGATQTVNSPNLTILRSFFEAIADACIADGINYFDKAYYYFDKIYDEVQPAGYPRMRDAINVTTELEKAVVAAKGLSGAVADSLKSIKHVIPFITRWDSSIFDEFKGKVIVSPLFTNFTSTSAIEQYAQLQAEGHFLESYGAASFWPVSAHLIDDYMITTRDVFWSKFDYGLKGDLYWNMNAYCNYGTVLTIGYGRSADLYSQASRDGVTAGDGYLLYPGRVYGSAKPFPSLRLTAKRDGIDDYTYLDLLEKEYTRLAAVYGLGTDKIKSVLAEINSQIYGIGISKLNFSGLNRVRRTIATLIELAQSDAGLFIEDFKKNETSVRYSVVTSAATALAVNGAAGAGVSVGGGKKYAADAAYVGEALTLELSGSVSKSVALLVGKAPAALMTFEDSLGGLAVDTTQYGSKAELNSVPAYAQSGKSAKVTLWGHKFASNANTQNYRPSVGFAVSELQNASAITLWVYNDGEDLSVTLKAENSFGLSYDVDTFTLKAHAWRKITIDNFTAIGKTAADLARINRISISAIANFLSGDTAYARTLYIDSVYRAEK